MTSVREDNTSKNTEPFSRRIDIAGVHSQQQRTITEPNQELAPNSVTIVSYIAIELPPGNDRGEIYSKLKLNTEKGPGIRYGAERSREGAPI